MSNEAKSKIAIITSIIGAIGIIVAAFISISPNFIKKPSIEGKWNTQPQKPNSIEKQAIPDIGGTWKETLFNKHLGDADIKQNKAILEMWNFETPRKYSE